jgi:hypothetical protein
MFLSISKKIGDLTLGITLVLIPSFTKTAISVHIFVPYIFIALRKKEHIQTSMKICFIQQILEEEFLFNSESMWVGGCVCVCVCVCARVGMYVCFYIYVCMYVIYVCRASNTSNILSTVDL